MAGSLRVLLVTLNYPPPPGGIQTIVKNLERGLKELGHEVEVLHIDRSDFDWSISDLLPKPRWYYSVEGFTSRDYVYMNAVYRQTVEAIRTFEPDVVHAMHVKDWPAIVAAQERDIPTALSTYALELGNRPLASRAIRDVDVVHALTEFTESLIDDVAPDHVKTEIIPPSIDIDEYHRAVRRINGNERGDVVTMSRFVDRKNLETIIRAWKQLEDDVRGKRELVVAGDGENRNELERLASDTDDIHFPGWVNGKEKRELLAKSDVFAMVPRRNGYDVEGFGIVYIEAQAAKTPVIGSKHGGAPEAIDDAGIIVDNENDPKEVAEAIRTLIADEEIRETKLSNAAERIRNFDIPHVAERHVEMYNRVR
ncbi:glycosyltransferase family 4 protein [Halopiger djelfimassiliensis]|uniref:glycosyltransferase family 4 protein n=1 Tax=Halopiger djelfimassiliensis TaxID=1293047 RepID=UPI0009DC3F81|nr:glycosyltransferase family 4 protein [Halopiger djelfimassiliensis]